MTKLMQLLAGAGAGVVLVLAACGRTQHTAATTHATPPTPVVDQAAEAAKARMAQEGANEKLVEKLFAPGANPANVVKLLAPDYIQHNPILVRFGELNNVQGREAFKLFIGTFSKLHGSGNPFASPSPVAKGPRPPAGNMLYKVIAAGDMVMIIHLRYQPDPQHKGKFYQAFSFDTYRVQNGLLAEHWDDVTIPDKLPLFLKVPVRDMKFPKQPRHTAGA